MKRLIGLVAVALFATTGAAQDTTKVANVNMVGNWDFSFTSPQGAATWRIKFEQAADTLKGQASTDFGALDVTNGWVQGNDISFTLNLNFNGQSIQVNFAGTVKGDTVSGNVDVPGVGIQPFPFTGVKVPAFDNSSSFAASMPAERPRLVRLSVR